MTDSFNSSDVAVLDLLRKQQTMNVNELANAMQVTRTAVRQRLTRLMGQGLIDRSQARLEGRGRPEHRYELTESGRRKTGANFADLAMALWEEIRAIKDPDVRRGLLQRIAKRMADQYSTQLEGKSIDEKMRSLQQFFEERQIPFDLDESGQLPVLTALACPYPDLAEQDRAICSMEKQMFSEVLGEPVRLTECRLDGEDCCCRFEVSLEPGGSSN